MKDASIELPTRYTETGAEASQIVRKFFVSTSLLYSSLFYMKCHLVLFTKFNYRASTIFIKNMLILELSNFLVIIQSAEYNFINKANSLKYSR